MKKKKIDTERINPVHGYVYCQYCYKYIRSCHCPSHVHLRFQGTCQLCRPKDFQRLEDFVKQYIDKNKIIM